jgi:hypothetical protein
MNFINSIYIDDKKQTNFFYKYLLQLKTFILFNVDSAVAYISMANTNSYISA